MGGGLVYELIVTRLCKVSSLFGCMPHVRQRPEVALFGFVSTCCIASEVLIKASFIKKKCSFKKKRLAMATNELLVVSVM
jgi:hypothetical protein